MYGKFKTKLEEETGESVVYKQYSTNESLKLLLAGGQEGTEGRPKVFVVGAGLNEIAARAPKKGKGREETVKSVVDEQNTIVIKQGEKDNKSIFYLVPPFLRKEPAWLDDKKTKMMAMLMAESALKFNSGNVFVGSNIPIDEGKRKNVDTSPNDPVGKRTKDTSDVGDGLTRGLVETLTQFMQEMRENRKVDEDSLKKVEEKQKTTDEKVDKLTEIVSTDTNIIAAMREDVDASENETMKSAVVVKKLVATAGVEIPVDKKELSKYIQACGRSLVGKVLGPELESEIKFVIPLYMKGTRAAVGPNEKTFVPPFKITFKNKDVGVKFREQAIVMSKEKKEGFENTYFAHQQNAGTRVRTSLMWGVVDGLKKKGKEAWVNQNTNKPNIQIKEGGKIVKTITFVQAMQDHGNIIPKKTLEDVKKSAVWNFRNQLERFFIVLKD